MASENFTIQHSPMKKGVGKQVPTPADHAMSAQPKSSALPSKLSPQDEAFLEEMGVDPVQIAAELDGTEYFSDLPYADAYAALTSPTTADFHPATLPKSQPSASSKPSSIQKGWHTWTTISKLIGGVSPSLGETFGAGNAVVETAASLAEDAMHPYDRLLKPIGQTLRDVGETIIFGNKQAQQRSFAL